MRVWLDPKKMVELIEGVAQGCRDNGCALLGGETAEMPGFYQPGDYELVLNRNGEFADAATFVVEG